MNRKLKLWELDRVSEEEFKQQEKFPVIATTSKMLTTGIDTKMVKLVVLEANIGSITEFKQIIGRGTRIRESEGKV
jgi:type I restriction enzyme R subunit